MRTLPSSQNTSFCAGQTTKLLLLSSCELLKKNVTSFSTPTENARMVEATRKIVSSFEDVQYKMDDYVWLQGQMKKLESSVGGSSY